MISFRNYPQGSSVTASRGDGQVDLNRDWTNEEDPSMLNAHVASSH